MLKLISSQDHNYLGILFIYKQFYLQQLPERWIVAFPPSY